MVELPFIELNESASRLTYMTWLKAQAAVEIMPHCEATTSPDNVNVIRLLTDVTANVHQRMPMELF